MRATFNSCVHQPAQWNLWPSSPPVNLPIQSVAGSSGSIAQGG